MHTVRGALALAALFLSSPVWALDDDARARAQADLTRIREARAGDRWSSRGGETRQHEGFYFRADVGLGYMAMNLPLGSESGYSGLAVVSGLHVGGTIEDKALLGLQIWAASAQGAKLSPSPADVPDATIGSLGLGPELTVYFLPSNTYITAAAGVTWLTINDDSGSDTSKAGVGGRVTLGTEWMLGPEWGIGVAVSGSYSSNKFDAPELGGSLPFNAWTLGGVLSATYN
jgi:hypothetical protein